MLTATELGVDGFSGSIPQSEMRKCLPCVCGARPVGIASSCCAGPYYIIRTHSCGHGLYVQAESVSNAVEKWNMTITALLEGKGSLNV